MCFLVSVIALTGLQQLLISLHVQKETSARGKIRVFVWGYAVCRNLSSTCGCRAPATHHSSVGFIPSHPFCTLSVQQHQPEALSTNCYTWFCPANQHKIGLSWSAFAPSCTHILGSSRDTIRLWLLVSAALLHAA
jgi:hypothetical protein